MRKHDPRARIAALERELARLKKQEEDRIRAQAVLEGRQRAPTAFTYARVSHLDQVENGFSLGDQHNRLLACFKEYAEPKGYAWGQALRDEGVSAYKVPLFNRPEGRKLQMRHKTPLGLLYPGDMVIIDRVDRAFRSIKDMAITMEVWKENNIEVRFRDMAGVDPSSFYGELIFNFLGLLAQLESSLKRERGKERMAERRKLGYTHKGIVRRGFRVVNTPKGPVERPCLASRRIMSFIMDCRDMADPQWSYKKITVELERRQCALEGRPFKNSVFHNWFWNENKVRDWYKTGCELVEAGDFLPKPDEINEELPE